MMFVQSSIFKFDMEAHVSLKRLLAWLLRLGTEPRLVHWCLLIWWCDI